MPELFSDLGPVVDGRSLPRHLFDPDAPAVTASVPMLIGTNANEARLFGLLDPSLFSLNEADMRIKLKAFLQLTDDSKLDALIVHQRHKFPPCLVIVPHQGSQPEKQVG
jgi:para-nitrobenzyl esterase